MALLKTAVSLCFLVTAGAWDLARRRVPNALVLMGITSSLLISSWRGAPFLLPSLKGLAFGLGLGLVPFALRALGGGDVKTLGAWGSFVGPAVLWADFFGALVAGGVIGVLLLLPPLPRLFKHGSRGTPVLHRPRHAGSAGLPFTSLLALSAMARMTLLSIR